MGEAGPAPTAFHRGCRITSVLIAKFVSACRKVGTTFVI